MSIPAEDTVAVECPHCHVTLGVNRQYLGQTIQCGRCRQQLTVPAQPNTAGGTIFGRVSPGAPPRTPQASESVDIESLRTAGESALRVVCLVVSILLTLLLLLSCFGIFYLAGFMLTSWISLAFMMAHIKARAIQVTPAQLPEIHESACRVCAKLGLQMPPDVYVVQEQGWLNAFATRFASRDYVVLYAELVEACGSNTRELDMIVAHEIGHLALGHITWGWLLFPALFIPFLAQAYSRACEYSADLCGQAGCGDSAAAARGLLILAAGGRCARMASMATFLRQGQEVGGFWQTVIQWLSTHPWLTHRVQALHRADPITSGS
ncbi:MAG: M48 family metallopeptidase [Phycisphaerae bacterium]|nr:M48 family metallopeptidase [Phycisphaerae bacterium]